ncbi:MAG: hypothetical protein M3O92_05220 [Actinomycetota bacterium]|nr:hypothetical protein [Actinomycetota bacterium]
MPRPASGGAHGGSVRSPRPEKSGGDEGADHGGGHPDGLPAAELRDAARSWFHPYRHFLDAQAGVAEPEEGFDLGRLFADATSGLYAVNAKALPVLAGRRG